MAEFFGAASNADVMRLATQVAILLLAARLLGGLARRLGQPGVVGEILAGVVLGPSLLAGLVPAVGEWIVPQTPVQGYLLETVALIGVMLLLVVTGLETDLALIRRRIRVAFGVAVGGLVLPFVTGLVLGFGLPDDLLADPDARTVFALFVATAMSISAIPVLAKVLMDLDLMRREIGQTMLAAGMIDDITGWTLLGLVTALAGAGVLTGAVVAETVLMVLVFVVVTATLGRWLVSSSLRFVQERMDSRDAALALVIALAFAWGAFSQALHLEPVIGAFAVGILFGRLPRLPTDTVHKLESMALAVFAPVFFATAGLKVDIRAILEPRLLGFTLLVIGVATVGKVVGAYLGARFLSGQDHWTSLAFGSGLNARGALEIIIATIGLSLGILSVEMFSIIVVMAVVTSVMAPVALRFCLARMETGDDESSRLAMAAAMGSTFGARLRRIVVPVRPDLSIGGAQRVQAFISDRLRHVYGTTTTLLSVSEEAMRPRALETLKRLRPVFGVADNSFRFVTSDRPTEAILREAERSFDLMMVGTPTVSPGESTVFGTILDDLIKLAPCPTLVVRAEALADDWVPRRLVVPSKGTPSSSRALDLTLALADAETRVTACHVLTPTLSGARTDLAEDIAVELEERARQLGRAIDVRVVEAVDVELGILTVVREVSADLLILGTNVRSGTRRLHLGPRVENLVSHAPCPVVVLNA
ncbi:MAG TPA: cation:proton antiporter [Acidimicrobiia bacterium]|nr:cation:proton antiporter [Acidimicrobiia bacterium]